MTVLDDMLANPHAAPPGVPGATDPAAQAIDAAVDTTIDTAIDAPAGRTGTRPTRPGARPRRGGTTAREGRPTRRAPVRRRFRRRHGDAEAPDDRPRSSAYVLLLANVAVLNAVGLVFVLSSSSVQALEDYGTSWFFFAKQLQWALVAIAALLLMSRVDYHRLRRFAVPMMFGSLALLAAVQVPGVGVGAGGATRWLGAGPVRFQPSEVAKFALVLYLADLMTRRAHLAGEWRRGVQPLVIGFLAIAFFVMLQPDLGTTLVLAITFLAAILVGGVRWRHLLLIVVSFAAAAAAFSVAVPWRRRRLFTFLDPWKDTSNAGYQVAQSFIAVASGRWTGVGLGAGRAKWSFLPNAHNDFIFAIIAEEVGFVGCLLVLALFGIFAVLGIRTALKAPDRFGCLLAAGITAWVVGQAMVNIATVVGLMPVTGVPLPFISFGGTALVIVMAAVGVLLSVARQAR